MPLSRPVQILAAVAIGGGVLLLYPFQVTVADRWSIRVTNSDGHPIRGCSVEQRWRWRALGVESFDIMITDESGYALFPPRTARASIVGRTLGNIATFNFHGPGNARHVEFFACNERNARTLLGIQQSGPTMSFEHRLPTVWRDSSMLK
jgi:hypothetical protein